MEPRKGRRLSSETLRRFAEVAGLKFSDTRLERMVPRVELYLEEVDKLQEVDVSDVEPDIVFSAKPEETDER